MKADPDRELDNDVSKPPRDADQRDTYSSPAALFAGWPQLDNNPSLLLNTIHQDVQRLQNG